MSKAKLNTSTDKIPATMPSNNSPEENHTGKQRLNYFHRINIDNIDITYKNVKAKRDWVKATKRVNNLLGSIEMMQFDTTGNTCNQIYDIFSFEHHVRSANELWNQLNRQREMLAVVFGHKNHGKTQFLFFLLRVLQEMGEYVVYFDKTIIPRTEQYATHEAMINSLVSDYCVNYWKDEFNSKLKDAVVKAKFEIFMKDSTFLNFHWFMKELEAFSRSNKQRVWVIVDDVTALDVKYRHVPLLELPEEQKQSPFSFIVTGSAGMRKWVGKQHLNRFVFDLPPFTRDEGWAFASSLINSLGKTDQEFAEYFQDIMVDGIVDGLEEMFGGIPGYIAECILQLSNGASFMDYCNELEQRIRKLIADDSLDVEKYSNRLLKEISEGILLEIQNLGLCGNKFPRGIILSLLLKVLTFNSPDPIETQISRISNLRAQINDPVLDGCLLELEIIVQFKYNRYYSQAKLISSQNNDINSNGQTLINLPSTNIKWTNVWHWNGETLLKAIILAQLDLLNNRTISYNCWELITLPVGFPVADIVMVHNLAATKNSASASEKVLDTTTTAKKKPKKNSTTARKKANPDITPTLLIYYIQITRSPNPFLKHKTIDECSNKSKEKIDMLTNKIAAQHAVDSKAFATYFVMLAPNCQSVNKQSSSFYFSNNYW